MKSILTVQSKEKGSIKLEYDTDIESPEQFFERKELAIKDAGFVYQRSQELPNSIIKLIFA